MTEQKRSACENCGLLIAPGKSLCTKCELEADVEPDNMAARLEKMEAASSGHLDAMRQRRDEITGKMDFSLREKHLAERAKSKPAAPPKPSEPSTPGGPELDEQAPAVFARLERLCSEIRHSIVEACFYNLKLQAQLLPQKIGSADFMQEFRRNIEQLPAVASRLKDFFDEEIEAKLKLSILFEDEHRSVMEGLQQLRDTSSSNSEPTDQSPKMGTRLSESIDKIIASLQSIDDRIRRNKVDVSEMLKDVAASSRVRCDEAGVTLTIELPEEPLPKLFSTGSVLSDSLLELVRNSLKHAFPLGMMAEKCIEIAAHLGDGPHRPIVIKVSDNGQGLPDEILETAHNEARPSGNGGFGLPMVVHNIENLHGGQVLCENIAGEGARFVLHIPTRIG